MPPHSYHHPCIYKSYAEVAAAEGVNESAVRHAVERGLKNMKNYLKNCQ